jgi:flagellar basal body rod protein FlgF
MEMQRQFEINMKLISAAKDLDEGGAQLLRLPNE